MTPTEPKIELDALYQEVIRDHCKDPRNYGRLENPDAQAEGYNPLCGDQVSVALQMNGNECIKKICFQSKACSICTASASMMTEEVERMTKTEASQAINSFRELMQGQKDPTEIEGDLQSLAGVRNFPVRIKCALLPWLALRDALEKDEKKA